MKRRPRPAPAPPTPTLADTSTTGRRPRKALRLAIAVALVPVVVAAVALLAPAPRGAPGPLETPEGALRAFFLASALGDEAALREVALPAPGFERLLGGKRVPAGKADEFRRSIAQMSLKRIKPGAAMELPNGRLFELPLDYPTQDRVWILPEGTAYPTELRRVGSIWKVDARKIIAAREVQDDARRADEARRRAGR